VDDAPSPEPGRRALVNPASVVGQATDFAGDVVAAEHVEFSATPCVAPLSSISIIALLLAIDLRAAFHELPPEQVEEAARLAARADEMLSGPFRLR
jgi:hypothetical protein